MTEDRDIAIGQVWESDTGLKWRVIAIGPGNYVTVQRVDKPDRQYVWHPASVRACKKQLVHQPNARFWVWENDGWIKLTLKPGQTLRWAKGGKCDEGFSIDYNEYEYDADDGVVLSRFTNESQDCDGRHSYYGDAECPISELQARPPEPADPEWGTEEIPVPRPEWRKVSASQRDYYAEAMGY